MSISIDLSGRRALVTGAGRGIGKGIALRLAEAGADVAVNDLDPAAAEATAEAVRALGRRSVAVAADIRTAAAVDAVAARRRTALGGVDILVNNAGISLYRAIVDCSEDDWDAHLDIMAKATFLTIRRLAPAMMERGWGRIVNLGLLRRPAQHAPRSSSGRTARRSSRSWGSRRWPPRSSRRT